MKHRLAALFLAAALFCTLLAGCAPTPDVPGPGGGSSSSGSTNNGGNSESEDNNNGGNTATKLQPKAYMEAYNVSYITSKIISKNPYVANYVFSVVNPNKNYSLSSVKISIDLTDNNGKPLTDYTTIQSIAPGDTVRFAYSASYSVPVHMDRYHVDTVLSSYFKTPETESDGTPKIAKSSDINSSRRERNQDFLQIRLQHYQRNCAQHQPLSLQGQGFAAPEKERSDRLCNLGQFSFGCSCQRHFPRYDLCTQKYRLRLV